MKTILNEQFPASIEVMESIEANTSKFAPIINEVIFFLKAIVIMSTTILVLASAWI